MPKDRESYSQSITRHLFSLRGAPFLLSAREWEVLESWADSEIGLEQVLEGIKQGYAALRSQRIKRGRKLTLNYCHVFVLQAHAQHQDRQTGKAVRIHSPENKRREIRAAVTAFLRKFPEGLEDLRDTFDKIRAHLDEGGGADEKLELWDEEIDRLLFLRASQEERSRLNHELAAEYGPKDAVELERLVRLKWVKNLRDRFRIPYVSPFYY